MIKAFLQTFHNLDRHIQNNRSRFCNLDRLVECCGICTFLGAELLHGLFCLDVEIERENQKLQLSTNRFV